MNLIKKNLHLIVILLLVLFCFTLYLSLNKEKIDDMDEVENYRKFIISGDSMYPTIKNNDIVIAKMSNQNNNINYQHKDIIIFKLKLRDETFIKRIIAVSGDEVLFKSDGFIYLNGDKLNEKYINDKSFNNENIQLLLKQINYYNNKIPENYYLVLGDNRENSLDSSKYGLISSNVIKGQVIYY
jgi:signal peptidase I